MPTEKNSDPRSVLILKVGLLAVVTLVAVRAALVAYFDRMVQHQVYVKSGAVAPDALINLRQSEKDRLTAGPNAIDQAMAKISEKGRMNASPDIAPSQSRDVAPLQGWAKMPQDVPAPMMAPPPAPSTDTAPPASARADAGGAPSQPPKDKEREKERHP